MIWNSNSLGRVALAATVGMFFAGATPAVAPWQPVAHAYPSDTVGPATRLSSAALRADVATLRRVYTALHPGLYRYATPAEVAARFDAVDRYFAVDRTAAEAFLALTRLTASIRCGHSYPNFLNQPERIANGLFAGRDKLPLEFRWLDHRLIVTRDVSDRPQLPRGTEVLAINGVTAGAVLDSLMPYARADGGNDAKRVAYLEVRGPEAYQAFDVLRALAFPSPDSIFTLRVQRPGAAAVEVVRLRALDLVERRARSATATTASDSAPIWRYGEADGVGVVTMPSWALYDSKWNWKRWTDSLMDDVIARRVPALVLDLRGNEGGQDAGDAFLARIAPGPITLPRYDRFVRAPRVPDALRPVLSTWDESFYDWGPSAVPVDSLRWRLTKWDDTAGGNIITPTGTRYTGRVFVIVGAVNSSATFQFALAVKESGLGTLVGQPTGGNRRGINGSAFFFVGLPQTGFEVDLPLVAGMPATPQPDAGVAPDVRVTPTVSQIAAGTDAELAAVKRLLRR